MMTTVLLYGPLGKRCGRRWRLDVETPAEVVRAISLKFPEFKSIILRDLHDYKFGVRVGGSEIGEELLNFKNNGRTITITPVLSGSGSKGFIQLIAGVALIAIGLIASAPFTIGLGISLVLGGIAQLLSPIPKTNAQESKTSPSYQFANVVNTAIQGECVPVAYGGPLWIGSAVVSAGFESVDITQGSTSPGGVSTGTPSGGGGSRIFGSRWGNNLE